MGFDKGGIGGINKEKWYNPKRDAQAFYDTAARSKRNGCGRHAHTLSLKCLSIELIYPRRS
jgi:hypothetical protein